MKFLTSTRSSLWWGHLILPLTFWVYLVSFQDSDLIGSSLLCTHILVASACIAVLGYLTNDYFDQQEDLKVGKSNFFQGKGKRAVLILPSIALLSAALWFFLPINRLTVVLLVSEAVLFLLYSVPPVRLKNNMVGVLVDALYSRVIPVLTILSLSEFCTVPVLTLAAVWMLLAGTRNILLHQLDDLENDKISGTQTAVRSFGHKKIRSLILRYILPLEVIAASGFLIFLSSYISHLYVSLVLFPVYVIVRYKVWRKQFRSGPEWSERALYLLNDLYSYFLPLILLIVLGRQEALLLFFVVLHLLLFPHVFKKFKRDGLTVWQSIVPYFEKLYFHGILKCWSYMSYRGNKLIFHFFLLFNVNLKTENLTVLEYFKKLLTK